MSARPVRRSAEGVLVMLATVAGLQILSGTPLRVPNPPAFLLVAMVFAAFRSGLRIGLIAAAIAWLHIAFYFSLPGRPFEYNPENFRRVAVWAVAVPAIAAMVGVQRRRLNQAGDLRYRDLFNTLPIALYQTTPDGRFLAVNRACAHLLGHHGPEEMVAANPAEFYLDPGDRSRWLETIEREGIVRDYETQVRRKDGAVIWVRETARAIRDAAGRIYSVEGSLEDVSARKAVDEQVRKLHLATEQSPAIVLITDTHEQIEYVNPRFTEVTGYTPGDVIGMPATRLADPMAPEEQRRLRETIDAGATWHGEFHAFKKSGDRYWERATVSSLRAPDGAITHFIKVAEDITEQKKALESRRELEERFRALIERSADAISLLSAQGEWLYESPAAERIAGYAPGERAGHSTFEYVHADDRDRIRALFADLLACPGGSVSAQFRYRHKEGRWLWLEATATNLLEEPNVGAVVVNYRDVTARRQIEDQIRQLNSQLEQKVVERTAELRDAKDEAERANRAKSDFLSRMSHELRTPLNAILGFAQLLEMEALPAEHRDSVRQILRGGKHLLTLVNEVLDITRIESGQSSLSLEPVRLADAVEESLNLIMPLAAQRGIEIASASPEAWERHVLADSQRLRQVLLNLLSNAVKFNRDRGVVRISCEDRPSGRLRISVADTGPGIPKEKLVRLFVPFERLGADRVGVEGTGLGLAHSRALVESMGAEIGVESEPGRGSVFWIDLIPADEPAVRWDQAGAAPAAGAVRAGRTYTVLYIDNNPSNHALMQRFLAQRPDVRMMAAMQGRLGLDLARQHHPDLILLDLHLEDLSGDEVLRRLAADPPTARIPVVILSADLTAGQDERLLALGAREFLPKPLDLRRFQAILSETLPEPSRVGL